MNADVAARLREIGQFLEDVDEAWEFVADALIDGPEDRGDAVDHLVAVLQTAT